MTTVPAPAQPIPSTGRSAVWVANNVLGVQDVAVREPGPGEVLVRIRACGICGSDLHAFHMSTPRRSMPGIGPGHELAGEVVGLGPGVAGPSIGTHVAMLAGTVCGECASCRRGQEQRCSKLRIAGGSYPGGMGEFFMAQAGFVYPVPEDMPWEIAALSEPCAISLHALKRAKLARGQRVLVLGAGAIGLFATLVAKDAGAGAIGVTARYQHQREVALSLGATHVFEPDEVRAGAPAAGMGWDIVVETVGGTAPTLQQAIDAVATGGAIALVGIHTAPQQINTWRVFFNELTIVGAFGYDHEGPRSDYEETILLLDKYRDLVAPLVTHTYPLDRAADAFATALDKATGAIKVTVLP
ncbi:MAG: zinc-dependent alcohol dehydrogenase [Dehalococcoidia bacterium]